MSENFCPIPYTQRLNVLYPESIHRRVIDIINQCKYIASKKGMTTRQLKDSLNHDQQHVRWFNERWMESYIETSIKSGQCPTDQHWSSYSTGKPMSNSHVANFSILLSENENASCREDENENYPDLFEFETEGKRSLINKHNNLFDKRTSGSSEQVGKGLGTLMTTNEDKREENAEQTLVEAARVKACASFIQLRQKFIEEGKTPTMQKDQRNFGTQHEKSRKLNSDILITHTITPPRR